MNEKGKDLFMLAKEWGEIQPRIKIALSKVDDIHALVPEIHQRTRYLENLSALPLIAENIKNSAENMKTLTEALVAPATGRDQIPTKTATLLFKILGFVIVSLVLIIAFLLTGDHFSILPHLKGLQ